MQIYRTKPRDTRKACGWCGDEAERRDSRSKTQYHASVVGIPLVPRLYTSRESLLGLVSVFLRLLSLGVLHHCVRFQI